MSQRSRRWALLPALVALVVQLVVLYAPSGLGSGSFPHGDKLVHATVFALPVFFALLARLPGAAVVTVAALHAPGSEIVQARLLAERAGDPWDAVADLVGVGLGVLAAVVVGRRDAGPDRDRW